MSKRSENYKRLLPYLKTATEEGATIHHERAGLMSLNVTLLYEGENGVLHFDMNHHYTKFGDFMYEPRMTLEVDSANAIVRVMDWELSGIAYLSAETPDGGYIEFIGEKLSDALSDWLDTIEANGYSK